MSIKVIAPSELRTPQIGGVSDKTYTTGTYAVDEKGTLYIRAKVYPGTASVTGVRWTVLYPYPVSNVITRGYYSHDLSDSPSHAATRIAITQFPQLTAVTHYGWAAVRGVTKYKAATTNPIWIDGVGLQISTTDNRLNCFSMLATTSTIRLAVGFSLSENGVTTGTLTAGTTINISLDGKGHGA